MPSLLASPPFHLLAVSCLLPVLYGCVSTATVSRLRPAEAGVVGVYRVGVLPLIGPEQQAPEAQQALLETVNETGRYQLVTADQMQQAAPGPLIGPDGDIDRRVAMEAGWRLGVDAILIGSVQLTEEGWSETGSVRMIIGSPTLRAVCQLELIDVRSGMTLFAGGGEAAEKLDVGDSPVSSNVRMHIGQRLACRSVVAAARRITPHQVTTDVALSSDLFGKGSVALWRGNYLAREGRWDEAQQQWLTALSENPENDAAIYSVGLAHEARGEFAQAEQRYREAIEIADRPPYREALQRVQQAGYEHHVACSQLTTPQPSPNSHLSRRLPAVHAAAYDVAAENPAGGSQEIGRLSPIDSPRIDESRLPPPYGGPASRQFYR